MLTAVERIPLESYFHSATNNFGSYVVGLAEGQYHPDALNWNGNIFHFIFALALNVYFCSIWLFHTSRTIYIGHRYRSFMLNSTGRLRILLYVTSANTHENRQKCHVHSKYWQIIQPDPQHVLTTAQLIGWNTVLAFNSFVSTAKLPFIHQCVPSIGLGAATCCKEICIQFDTNLLRLCHARTKYTVIEEKSTEFGIIWAIYIDKYDYNFYCNELVRFKLDLKYAFVNDVLRSLCIHLFNANS